METTGAIKFYSMGNSALLVQWGNDISRPTSQQVNSLANAIKQQPFIGLIDLVPAYCSLTILYDVILIKQHISTDETAYSWVQKQVGLRMSEATGNSDEMVRLIEIPVCYDESLNNDLELVSKRLSIEKSKIIYLHSGTQYYIYMQGFVPGFAYMGEVNERISMPRKNIPVAVKAGAVGIAGRQTGIYPVDSPGGWHILGYTPIKLFDTKKEPPCLLQAGSLVQFNVIDLEEYNAVKSQQSI